MPRMLSLISDITPLNSAFCTDLGDYFGERPSMARKMTHIGRVDYSYREKPSSIELRETANFWVSSGGTKYRKKDGCIVANWPTQYLDLKSIKPK